VVIELTTVKHGNPATNRRYSIVMVIFGAVKQALEMEAFARLLLACAAK
jgi:hypothetical protein